MRPGDGHRWPTITEVVVALVIVGQVVAVVLAISKQQEGRVHQIEANQNLPGGFGAEKAVDGGYKRDGTVAERDLRHEQTPTRYTDRVDHSGAPGTKIRATVEPVAPPKTFKVLTYNVWHGGLHIGPFWVRLKGSPEQNDARFQVQVRQIVQEQPDLLFLQEVNPLPGRADDYVRALKDVGLDYSQVHQVESCGLRLGHGVALIPKLNSGLAILAKTELRLQRLQGLRTLGDWGTCRSTWGFQVQELRYALIGEITWPGGRTKYLVATAHQHAGFEASAQYLQEVRGLGSRGRGSGYLEIKKAIERSRAKRKDGLLALVQALHRHKRDQHYAGVIIGGDFNFEPGSPEYRLALRLGLTDTHGVAARERELSTFDPIRNDLILDSDAPSSAHLWQAVMAKVPVAEREGILAAYRKDRRRPRRIDYIFVDSFLPNACLRQKLFGLELDPEGRPASDHYGVLNIYDLEATPCPGKSAGAKP